MLQAGKLTQRIVLQACVVTKGASGGVVKGWQEVAQVWTAVRHLSGNERRATGAGGQVAEARTEFTIRHRAGVNAQMRVLYGDAVYNIRHVNDFMARREFLILTCDAGGSDG